MQEEAKQQDTIMDQNELIRSWTTTLERLRQENVLLKNRLSFAIQQPVSPTFLEEAELFQQRFIDKDQVIDLLRHDISMLARKGKQNHGAIAPDAVTLVLTKDMHTLVLEFNQMRDAFNNCLTENGV